MDFYVFNVKKHPGYAVFCDLPVVQFVLPCPTEYVDDPNKNDNFINFRKKICPILAGLLRRPSSKQAGNKHGCYGHNYLEIESIMPFK